MDFVLFLLVNAALFIRPSELSPALAPWPIYEILILSCIATALPKIARQLTLPSLAARPITACVVGLLIAVVLSHLAHLSLWGARIYGFDFLKVLLYYLLLVGVIDSVPRLRGFLFWIATYTVVLCALAVLQYHGVVDVIDFATRADTALNHETGERVEIVRICSTGIFNDPNDLAMILVLGMVVATYGLTDHRFRSLALVWIAAIVLFGYAFALTHSRGGMLGLLAAVLAFVTAKYGLRRAALLGLVAIPALFAVFAGRQTDFSEGLAAGTGMHRIQLWAMGLSLLRQDLLFGIGYGNFAEQLVNVAHNSYVNAFTELGLFGGTLFLGAFLISIAGLWHIGYDSSLPGELRRLRPYLLAIVAGYAAAMLTLSREGVVPTYMILGLAAVSLRLADRYCLCTVPRLTGQLVKRMAFASVCYIGLTYIFIRLFARWG